MNEKTAKRWDRCQPEIILGRKLWVARRGFYGSGVPEVWVHLSPYFKHIAYIKGRSLAEGSPEENADYLAGFVSERLAKLPPISDLLEKMWDEEVAEIAEDHAMADV